MTGSPYKLGWFSTARGKGSRDLLATVHEIIGRGEIKAEIAFVFCSREPGESPETDLFLEQVRSYHVPLVCFSYRRFSAERRSAAAAKTGTLPEWRLGYDREVMKRLQAFRPDLCVLAGYMLIVGKEMCQKYNMINLHPAAPDGPAGTWQEVIWRLIETEARETGVMMHLVTPELDRGPVVTYCTFSIRGAPFDRYWTAIAGQPIEEVRKQGENHPLFKLIRRHGLAREFPLIASTIKTFSQDEIRTTADKKLVDVRGKPLNGYDLSRDIDEAVKGQLG